MNNMLNSKLLDLLSGVDRNKLDQISNMVKNMTKEDIANLVNMLGINNTANPNGPNKNE